MELILQPNGILYYNVFQYPSSLYEAMHTVHIVQLLKLQIIPLHT